MKLICPETLACNVAYLDDGTPEYHYFKNGNLEINKPVTLKGWNGMGKTLEVTLIAPLICI